MCIRDSKESSYTRDLFDNYIENCVFLHYSPEKNQVFLFTEICRASEFLCHGEFSQCCLLFPSVLGRYIKKTVSCKGVRVNKVAYDTQSPLPS